MNSGGADSAKANHHMDTITICDLEVQYRVGVTAEERASAQRLLITIEIKSDFRRAAGSDDLGDTIDYAALCERVQQFGDDCHWQLIETVAVDLAEMIQAEFGTREISIEVKKFVIPAARFVSVRTTRRSAESP